MQLPKILFFVKGPFPSDEQKAAAAAIGGAKVMFRNALAVDNEPHALEVCDGVTGDVPPIYAKRFPAHGEALAKHRAAIKALSEKAGDTPAPVRPVQPQAPVAPWGSPQGKPPAWNPNPNPPA